MATTKADTSQTAAKLAERAQTAGTATPGTSLNDLLRKQVPAITRALPASQGLTAERFLRLVLTEVRRTPTLLECTQESFLGAVMLSAQLGLEPGPLGHAWYVPFFNNKIGRREAQFIIGYKGMIDLARRSRQIRSLVAREVYEKDHFEFEYGTNERLVHKPKLDGSRGKVVAYYGVALFTDGGQYVEVMSPEDIEERRGRSKAKDSGPWQTDYIAMAKKTVIRKMFPYLPVSTEAARAVEFDEAIVVDLGDLEDLVPPEPQQDETPEPDASETPESAEDAQVLATEEQIAEIKKLAGDANLNDQELHGEICAATDKGALDDLTGDDAANLITHLQGIAAVVKADQSDKK